MSVRALLKLKSILIENRKRSFARTNKQIKLLDCARESKKVKK